MTEKTPVQNVALAWTGASGIQYGMRLLDCLMEVGCQVSLMISKPAQVVIGMETDLELPSRMLDVERSLRERYGHTEGRLRVYGQDQWTAPLASGSSVPDAMVICPCSAATVAAVATGASRSLIERAADVVLKEQRRLILVVRETPLSLIQLENLVRIARAGGVIMPAAPGFYHRPGSVQELVDFMVARILDHLSVPHTLAARWGRENTPPGAGSGA